MTTVKNEMTISEHEAGQVERANDSGLKQSERYRHQHDHDRPAPAVSDAGRLGKPGCASPKAGGSRARPAGINAGR